jgi:hypothetical protein
MEFDWLNSDLESELPLKLAPGNTAFGLMQ